jgi:hypothetical protein
VPKIISIIDLLALGIPEGAIALEIESRGLWGFAPGRKKLRPIAPTSKEVTVVLAGLSVWLNVSSNGASSQFESWYALEDPCAEFGWPEANAPTWFLTVNDDPGICAATARLRDRYSVFNSPLITMGRLLMLGQASAGEIASAIERIGIYGDDSYGRMSFHAPHTLGSIKALDALRSHLSRLNASQPLEIEPYLVANLNTYGFHPDQVPDFFQFSLEYEANQRAHQARLIADQQKNPSNASGNVSVRGYSENGNATKSQAVIIAALMSFIRGEITPGKHPDFVNQEQLIKLFDSKFPEGYGLSDRNLKKRFAEANRIRNELDLAPLPNTGDKN